MKKPPCIRNIDKFKKTGCPQKSWDGEEGCTAWVELSVATKGNPLQHEVKKQCIDLWSFEFAYAGLGTMEGIQAATEGGRNMNSMMALAMSGGLSKEKLQDVAERQLQIEKKK